MNRNRLILTSIVFAGLTLPAWAAPARYAISTEQVATAVGKMGVRIDPSQVTLLADVVAVSPYSALTVRSVERLGSDRFVARMECANSDECLPFMASVHLGGEDAAQLIKVSSSLSLLKDATPEASIQPRTKPTLIRSGAHAMLQLDGSHIHIRIPVICLQNGSEGQTVRATDVDHKQIYAAKVAGEGLLQGKL